MGNKQLAEKIRCKLGLETGVCLLNFAHKKNYPKFQLQKQLQLFFPPEHYLTSH